MAEVESCGQQPTSGTGDRHEHDADLFSRLPDDVLGGVITLLPTKDGARTQLLSRRWRRLWRSAPLNLEGSVADATDRHRLAAILRAHRCSARRVSITITSELLGLDDLLLRSPGLDSLQELELHNHVAINDRHCKSAPPLAAFCFSSTLRVLALRGGDGRGRLREHLTGDATYGALAFPHLDQLTLESVHVSESGLHGLLSGCPVLRSLVLRHNAGHRRLRITSSTLRSLGVTADYRCPGPKLEGIVVENVPVLERIVLDGDGCFQIRVIEAPKLKVLGYIDPWNCKKVEFVGRLNDARRAVKILALIIPHVELEIVLDILQCFPYVEKLHITMLDWRMNSEHEWCYTSLERLDAHLKTLQLTQPLESLDAHLKTLQLTQYYGYNDEVNLIRLFLLHARALESVKLVVSCHDKHNDEWFNLQARINGLQASTRSYGLVLEILKVLDLTLSKTIFHGGVAMCPPRTSMI